jgi:hypothetical protein
MKGPNGSSILQAASAVGRLADRKLATELRAMRLGLAVLVPRGVVRGALFGVMSGDMSKKADASRAKRVHLVCDEH